MAGTIISTPALGASDWSDFITQQERTDRGYMRLSLTNFSDTTASTIATGGVLEVAGSIYQFTDTAIALATGTASADTAVYFHVIPSAGGTSVTIEMDSTAPTWVDAKQGFYASAASVSRVIGGCRIGTAATYYHKFLYTPTVLDYCLREDETRPLLKKMIEIGEWNMDATQTVDVDASPIIRQQIRDVTALVRSDSDVNYLPIYYGLDGGYVGAGANQMISVIRKASGSFDNTNYNATASTVANRGWVIVWYEA